MEDLKLGIDVIRDQKSVEYHWVRTMYVEGYSEHEIDHYINQCFGGDSVFAHLFRKVALHQESVYVLMQHLGHAPSNLENI
ncbi:hypothetical protein BCU00_010675 [Vibrio breoganii]|uniref:Uncharacterized protein n=1 Tax=Vibrio breoganii TaxID=553239 RepID=A0AAN0XYL7_9VIBR|nr:hypothetical protein [Vibrio breoganii]ANO34877.1 hypothetical protein A6E01_16955 [Vibrio breoganii]PMG99064.1 hypothetical protein BCU80_18045 [Vibrio breoganii]PMK40898.1 hypothetical protein BCU00_15110 [Vibrio breoganii]PMO33975.1 hypothetical protein BCT12_01190 [Vibrio breoganii]